MSIRVVFGEGALDQVGLLGRELGFSRALIVADKGIVGTGFVDRAPLLLDAVGIVPFFFHNFGANPDTDMVEAGPESPAAGRPARLFPPPPPPPPAPPQRLHF